MKNKKIKIMIALLILSIVGILTSIYGYNYESYKTNLKNAETLLNDERYDEAASTFLSLKSSKFASGDRVLIDEKVNLASELKQSKEDFDAAMKLFNEKKYIEAIDSFKNVKEADNERYIKAQDKIKEAGNLYVKDSIEKAKEEAGSEKYDNAIELLQMVLKFDGSNEEAGKLKDTYNNEIQRMKDEETKKSAAPKIVQKQPVNSSNINSSKSSSSNSTKTVQAPSNNSGYTVTADSDGWFSIDYPGRQIPEGFGLVYANYGLQPNGIYYKFLGTRYNVKYEITFHLPTGDVKDNGTGSGDIKFIGASEIDVPKSEGIKVDISVVYNGKTYTTSTTKYINHLS